MHPAEEPRRPAASRPVSALRFLGVLVTACVVGIGILVFLDRPPGTAPTEVRFAVRDGERFSSIADRLAEAGLIRSPLLFRVRARVAGIDRAIQPGLYRLRGGEPIEELLHALATGVEQTTVTIPEGRTLHEIAEALAARGLGTADAFLCLADDPAFLLAAGVPGPHLEGYLFPDTYKFNPGASAEEVLSTMVRRFHEQFGAEHHRRAADRGLTVDQVVTLASIVEKETGAATERPLIAGVFDNRLRRGMPLQSDPTVIYGLPAFSGDLTRADLASPSPYNTYVHAGLPPGPIANPGLAALEAVLAPTASPYLYFVARNDGTHAFSATLAEHNRAVDRYQRGPSKNAPAR